jgi:putative spermidine/putrescine transport system permease protein
MTGTVAATPQGAWAVRAMLAPAVLFLIICFVAPVIYMLALSVTGANAPFGHFIRIFTVPVYLKVLLNTFTTALIVTLWCLALGYPLAYVMATRKGTLALILFAIVAMSFWTGFVVRTYAWLVMLGNKGVLVALAALFDIGAAPQLLFTSFASTLGMVHILLPFMVMALYGVMRRIDATHLRAAHSLGATPFRAFIEVFLPLSMPGVVNGSVLVFTLCLGFYVTPILLGTPQDMMISQLITQQVEELLAWDFAAALAALLLAVTLALLAIYNRIAGLDRLWG